MKIIRDLAAIGAVSLVLGVLALTLELGGLALAQSAITVENHSQKIVTGNTYQAVLVADPSRVSLTIQNNNTNTDNCWVDDTATVAVGNTASTNVTTLGGTLTAAQASILLAPGQSYTRYYPHLPNGAIVATCAGTGDSLFVSR
jgi:hypothetical protein